MNELTTTEVALVRLLHNAYIENDPVAVEVCRGWQTRVEKTTDSLESAKGGCVMKQRSTTVIEYKKLQNLIEYFESLQRDMVMFKWKGEVSVFPEMHEDATCFAVSQLSARMFWMAAWRHAKKVGNELSRFQSVRDDFVVERMDFKMTRKSDPDAEKKAFDLLKEAVFKPGGSLARFSAKNFKNKRIKLEHSK